MTEPVRLKCSNVLCEFLASTDSEKMGSFCCKKCHMQFSGEVKKLKHGEKCEQKLAPPDLERAPVVEPKEPMKNPCGEAPVKKKPKGRSSWTDTWNQPVDATPAGIWKAPVEEQIRVVGPKILQAQKDRIHCESDECPVTDASSSVSSHRGSSRRIPAGHRSRDVATDGRSGSTPSGQGRGIGNGGASSAASHKDAPPHDRENSWWAASWRKRKVESQTTWEPSDRPRHSRHSPGGTQSSRSPRRGTMQSDRSSRATGSREGLSKETDPIEFQKGKHSNTRHDWRDGERSPRREEQTESKNHRKENGSSQEKSENTNMRALENATSRERTGPETSREQRPQSAKFSTESRQTETASRELMVADHQGQTPHVFDAFTRPKSSPYSRPQSVRRSGRRRSGRRRSGRRRSGRRRSGRRRSGRQSGQHSGRRSGRHLPRRHRKEKDEEVDSDSEYTIDSEVSIKTSYDVKREEGGRSSSARSHGEEEAKALGLSNLPRRPGKDRSQEPKEGKDKADASRDAGKKKSHRGQGDCASTPNKRRKAQSKKSSYSYYDDDYYSDSDYSESSPSPRPAKDKDKRASK